MNNINTYRKGQLKSIIEYATKRNPIEIKNKFGDEDVNKAMAIFKSIKKTEKEMDSVVLAQSSEEVFARLDLEMIFGIYDHNNLTLNQMYLLHNSKMVNAITQLIKEGEI